MIQHHACERHAGVWQGGQRLLPRRQPLRWGGDRVRYLRRPSSRVHPLQPRNARGQLCVRPQGAVRGRCWSVPPATLPHVIAPDVICMQSWGIWLCRALLLSKLQCTFARERGDDATRYGGSCETQQRRNGFVCLSRRRDGACKAFIWQPCMQEHHPHRHIQTATLPATTAFPRTAIEYALEWMALWSVNSPVMGRDQAAYQRTPL